MDLESLADSEDLAVQVAREDAEAARMDAAALEVLEEQADEVVQEVLAASFPSCAVAPGIRLPRLCAFPHGTTITDPR